MIGQLFSSDKFIALHKGLNTASLRQQVIADNVANINTPGFKKRDVSFEGELSRALENSHSQRLRQTNERHLSGGSSLTSVRARVTTVDATSMRYDGNNVDIDEEMSKLAENSIRFNALAQLMGGHFSTLKTVINEGRR